MKINKIIPLTGAISLLSSSAFAAPAEALQRGLVDWVSLVAEMLSFICLVVFILYMGRYLKASKNQGEGSAEGVKVTDGVRNGVMTALVGIGICQAVIIVAQIVFVK